MIIIILLESFSHQFQPMGLLLEWLQISSGLQESSQYSGKFKQYGSWDGLIS